MGLNAEMGDFVACTEVVELKMQDKPAANAGGVRAERSGEVRRGAGEERGGAGWAGTCRRRRRGCRRIRSAAASSPSRAGGCGGVHPRRRHRDGGSAISGPGRWGSGSEWIRRHAYLYAPAVTAPLDGLKLIDSRPEMSSTSLDAVDTWLWTLER